MFRTQPHSITELTPVHVQDSTAFYNRTHTCTCSGLNRILLPNSHLYMFRTQPHSRNTRTVWMEQDWTTSCLSRHKTGERIALLHKCVSNRVLCVLVTYSDGEISCVSSEMFRSRQFSTAPVSFVFCVRRRDLNDFQFNGLRHLWFYFGHWFLVCNTGLTPVARSYRQYLNTTVSCCVNETLRLSLVKEMRLSIPKTGSVNVAYVIAFLSFFRRENAIVKDTIGTFMESNGIPPGCHGNLHMQTPLN